MFTTSLEHGIQVHICVQTCASVELISGRASDGLDQSGGLYGKVIGETLHLYSAPVQEIADIYSGLLLQVQSIVVLIHVSVRVSFPAEAGTSPEGHVEARTRNSRPTRGTTDRTPGGFLNRRQVAPPKPFEISRTLVGS